MAVSARHAVARRLLKISFIAVSLGLVVHLILLSLPGIHQTVLVMRHLNPALLLVAVSLEAGSLIALAQLYRASVASFDHDIGFSQALRLSMAMFTLTRILPAGGAAAAVFGAAQLTDLDVKPASGATSVVVAGALGMTTLAAIVGAGAAASLLKGDLPAAYLAPVVLLLGIVLGIGYLAHRIASSVSFTRAVVSKLEKVLRRLRMKPDLTEIYAVVEELSRRMPTSRELRPLFGWSALNWLLDVAVLWLVFAALGHRLPIAVLLVGYGVANLAMALPITPGGLGLVEAGMSSTFAAFGVPAATAVVGVLGYRLISFWLPLLAGVPQYLATTRRLRAPETSASPG